MIEVPCMTSPQESGFVLLKNLFLRHSEALTCWTVEIPAITVPLLKSDEHGREYNCLLNRLLLRNLSYHNQDTLLFRSV